MPRAVENGTPDTVTPPCSRELNNPQLRAPHRDVCDGTADGSRTLRASGPNGAGKSTTATVLLPESLRVEQFVNADLIAKGLSPFAPQKSAIAAARLMLGRIRELRRRGESFALETTLATRTYVPFLRDARARGYVVHLVYVWLASVELARSRVAVRVLQGGHDVAEEIIDRRYWRGLQNFFGLYRPLADTWTLCDNSSEELVIVACGAKKRQETVFEPATYDRIRKVCPR